MTTYSKETALYDTGAIASGITDAGNTANTYITAVDQNGIKVHAANNVNSNYSKINAEGMEVYSDSKIASKFGKKGDEIGSFIYDGQGNSDENIIASFTDSGSVIGKAKERRLELNANSMDLYDVGSRRVFSVLNTTSDTLGTVYETGLDRTSSGYGVGTYSYELGLPYEGNLRVTLGFYADPKAVTGYGEVFQLNDGDFGDFTFSNVLMSATGNIDFDVATKTVTVVITSITSGYYFTRFLIGYTSYPQYPTVFIGANGNPYNIEDYALVVTHQDYESNALTIDRDGNVITEGRVVDQDTAYDKNYGNVLTNFKVNGYVSTSTTTLYATITTPKSMEKGTTVDITKSGTTCGVRGISGYVKDGSTNMTDGYSLNQSQFTLSATKNDDYHFTISIERDSAFSNVTNNTPVSLHFGQLEFVIRT